MMVGILLDMTSFPWPGQSLTRATHLGALGEAQQLSETWTEMRHILWGEIRIRNSAVSAAQVYSDDDPMVPGPNVI